MNVTPEVLDVGATIATVIALILGKDGAVLFWGWVKTKVTSDLEKRIADIEKKING